MQENGYINVWCAAATETENISCPTEMKIGKRAHNQPAHPWDEM